MSRTSSSWLSQKFSVIAFSLASRRLANGGTRNCTEPSAGGLNKPSVSTSVMICRPWLINENVTVVYFMSVTGNVPRRPMAVGWMRRYSPGSTFQTLMSMPDTKSAGVHGAIWPPINSGGAMPARTAVHWALRTSNSACICY